MKAYTYIKQGKFGFTEKEKPTVLDDHDAIVRVTLSSICTSDDIKLGTSMPRNMFLFSNAIYLLPYTGVGSGITRLAMRLRESGKLVIGMGRKSRLSRLFPLAMIYMRGGHRRL